MTVMTKSKEAAFPEEQENNGGDPSLADIMEDVEQEGLDDAEIASIDVIIDNYVGFHMSLNRGPQSRQWPKELKALAIKAAGGGDSDSASMSDKLFNKGIDAVKQMNSAISQANALKADRFYTLPHPRSGLRRVRLGKIETLQRKVAEAELRLAEAGEKMNADRETIKTVMRKKLGDRYAEDVYDVDFTKLLRVKVTYPALDVPECLKRFSEIYEGEIRRVRAEAEATVVLLKQQMAKDLFTVLDRLLARLEVRQQLDREHTVEYVKRVDDTYEVKYRRKGDKQDRKVYLTSAELAARVSDDDRKKVFKAVTAKKLFGELDYFERMMGETGIGVGDLKACFDRLRGIVRGENATTISDTLKQSSGIRNAMKSQLATLGEQVLDMSVIRPQRQILRRSSKSVKFNPDLI